VAGSVCTIGAGVKQVCWFEPLSLDGPLIVFFVQAQELNWRAKRVPTRHTQHAAETSFQAGDMCSHHVASATQSGNLSISLDCPDRVVCLGHVDPS